MKTKSLLLSLLAIASGICAYAQENDDMYFSSKDRAKINVSTREEVVLASAKGNTSMQTINPSDSYSARNENPDYIAGAKVGSNATTTSSYFTPTYQPTVNQSLYANSGNAYNNYGYGNNSYNSFGYPSPYSMYAMNGYGSMCGMGYNPYTYGMMGMGYGMGFPMMSYGAGFGYSNMYGMYGTPYMGMGGMYGYNPYMYGMMGYGYGMGMVGYNTVSYGYGAPTSGYTSVSESGPVYGRHPARGTSSISHYTSTTGSTRGNTAYYNGSGVRSSAARSTVSNGSSYYSNAWKQSAANSSSRSSWSNPNSSTTRSYWNNSSPSTNSWGNSGTSTRSTWGNSNSSFGNSSFGGARSTGGFSGGGGGFSGGGHSGGGGHGRR